MPPLFHLRSFRCYRSTAWLLLGLSTCTSEASKPVVTPTPPPKTITYSFKELAWSDEFDGAGLPNASRWSYETGGSGWGNNELEYYTANRTENARVENGHLVIEARKESLNGATILRCA